MKRLTFEQVCLLVASILSGLSAATVGLTTWHQFAQPVVVFSLLTNVAIAIRAFFTTANPADSTPSIDPKKFASAILIVASLGAGAVLLPACGIDFQTAVINGYSTAQNSLEAADDAEHLTCYGTTNLSTLPLTQIGHCSTAAAQTIRLTDDLHSKISENFTAAYAAQKRLGPVIMQLGPVAAVPPADLSADFTYANNVSQLVTALDPSVPSAQPFLSNVQQWIADVKSLFSKFTGSAPPAPQPAAASAS